MKTKLLLLLLAPLLSFSQIQIGSTINGESAGDFSGSSISLSADGNILAIGATDNDGVNGNVSGHVRIYENQSGNWVQLGSDIDGEAALDSFGESVSLSADGTIVAIGAFRNDNYTGHVRVFEYVANNWTQIGGDIDGEAEDDASGVYVSLSSDGNIVAIGAEGNDGNGEDSGHVRVYENISGVWTQIGEDINGEAADDYSGAVSLSSDGSILAIGALGNDGNGEDSGHARVYQNISDVWTQVGADIDGEVAGDGSGAVLSLSANGRTLAIGANDNDGVNGTDSGHVRVYENQSGNWVQIGTDIEGEAANDGAGVSVSLSDDGSILAVGAFFNDGVNGTDSGHVRVFQNQSGNWVQIGVDIDGETAGANSGFNVSLSSNGTVLAVSADSDTNGVDSGHVKVYDLTSVLSTKNFVENHFKLYPNPTKDILNISVNNDLEIKNVNVYNMLSQYLFSIKAEIIDTSNLISGFYFIEVETNQGNSTKKIVVE